MEVRAHEPWVSAVVVRRADSLSDVRASFGMGHMARDANCNAPRMGAIIGGRQWVKIAGIVFALQLSPLDSKDYP